MIQFTFHDSDSSIDASGRSRVEVLVRKSGVGADELLGTSSYGWDVHGSTTRVVTALTPARTWGEGIGCLEGLNTYRLGLGQFQVEIRHLFIFYIFVLNINGIMI